MKTTSLLAWVILSVTALNATAQQAITDNNHTSIVYDPAHTSTNAVAGVATTTAKLPEPATTSDYRPAINTDEIETVQQPIVFAKLGRTKVPAQLKARLDSIAAILQRHPEMHIVITGYTCDIGSEEQNKRIGKERGVAVATYLIDKGVAIDRMDVRSAGETNFAVPNKSEADRSKNRRVELQLIQ